MTEPAPPLDPAAVRFELTLTAIAPDGTRTVLHTSPIRNRCLVCNRYAADNTGRMTTDLGNVDGQIGLVCPTHPGMRRS